jgi:hypothetical protein
VQVVVTVVSCNFDGTPKFPINRCVTGGGQNCNKFEKVIGNQISGLSPETHYCGVRFCSGIGEPHTTIRAGK